MAVEGFDPGLPEVTSQSLGSLYFEMQEKLGRLSSELERWAVVDIRTSLFRSAFSINSKRMFPPFNDFLQHAMRAVVAQRNGDSWVYQWRLPIQSEREALVKAAEKLEDCGMDLLGILFDLDVEMQNLLVGSLFGAAVAAREPIDKTVQVIRLSDYDQLSKKFFNELRN